MAFPDLLRPASILDLIPRAYGNGSNTTGLQAAHVFGFKFWTLDLRFLDVLGIANGTNNIFNGVLLSETSRGGAILGTAVHRGQ